MKCFEFFITHSYTLTIVVVEVVERGDPNKYDLYVTTTISANKQKNLIR